jgi:hypothetical protein
VAWRYGHDNEPSGSTKGMVLIHQKSDYKFLKVIAPMELNGQPVSALLVSVTTKEKPT